MSVFSFNVMNKEKEGIPEQWGEKIIVGGKTAPETQKEKKIEVLENYFSFSCFLLFFSFLFFKV